MSDGSSYIGSMRSHPNKHQIRHNDWRHRVLVLGGNLTI
jgi:hypothetical protein